MLELQVIKNGGILYPYLEDDKAKLRAAPARQPFKITAVRQSQRSVQHNRLYWSGLIGLCMDYWEPEAGCVSPNEEAILAGFTRFLSKEGGVDQSALETAREAYMKRIRGVRAHKYQAPSIQAHDISDWILEELGMYDLYLTPSGWKKKLKRLNFNAMPTEAEFILFYKAAFGVVWK